MLTPTQDRTLRFIADYLQANGFGPSYTEIASALGLKSKSGVTRLVDQLQARGAIRRLRSRDRSIEIVRWPTVRATIFFPVSYDAAGLAFLDGENARPLDLERR